MNAISPKVKARFQTLEWKEGDTMNQFYCSWMFYLAKKSIFLFNNNAFYKFKPMTK